MYHERIERLIKELEKVRNISEFSAKHGLVSHKVSRLKKRFYKVPPSDLIIKLESIFPQ